jgi:shikimate kinase
VIVLIGFMGAGKTTVGRLLADSLGIAFADSDLVIEQRAGRPIREIFASEGEASFRALEHEVIGELLDGPGIVLALGGGAVEHPATASRLRAFDVVYLEVPYQDAMARVGGDQGRPLLAQPGLPDRYRRRLPSYVAVATRTVRTANRPPEAIAQEILIQRPLHDRG